MANLERGLRRLTWVVSVVLTLPFIAIGIADLRNEVSISLPLFGIALTAFTVTWGVFFVGRWVAGGFRDRGTQDGTRAFLVAATALAFAGCSAANVSVAPDAPRVMTGTGAPEGPHEQLGAITATHGGGCGLYGARGDFEGAHTKLRNKAAALGADYVQIIRVREPRLEGICMNQAFTIDGIAYKRVPQRATVPPPAVPATARPAERTGLDGTYTGEITGNAQGRAFTMRVSFTIVQSAEQIAGAWTTTGGTSGTITGILTEAGIRDLRARQLNPCAGEFAGVAVVEATGNRLRGSYVGRDCGGPVTASFTVDRQ